MTCNGPKTVEGWVWTYCLDTSTNKVVSSADISRDKDVHKVFKYRSVLCVWWLGNWVADIRAKKRKRNSSCDTRAFY